MPRSGACPTAEWVSHVSHNRPSLGAWQTSAAVDKDHLTLVPRASTMRSAHIDEPIPCVGSPVVASRQSRPDPTWLVFVTPHASPSLGPFAQTAFTALIATMAPLTSATVSCPAADLPASCAPPSLRSVPNHPIGSSGRLLHHAQRPMSVPDFTVKPNGSSPDGTETGSSSYGPQVRLRLLPTPPRDDAVAFSYGACG